jgi:hypothetical protein
MSAKSVLTAKSPASPILRLLAFSAAVGLVCFLLVNSSLAIEQASYRVRRKDGAFEVRQYESMMVAVTPMTGGTDSAFRRLFRFISGESKTGQKIAMTAPVLFEKATSQMSFVLPAKMVASGVPEPKDSSVRIEDRAAGTYAVLTYTGGRNPEAQVKALRRLQDWLQSNHYEAAGDPDFAYFDPPWTPIFLRRNEVRIPLRG